MSPWWKWQGWSSASQRNTPGITPLALGLWRKVTGTVTPGAGGCSHCGLLHPKNWSIPVLRWSLWLPGHLVSLFKVRARNCVPPEHCWGRGWLRHRNLPQPHRERSRTILRCPVILIRVRGKGTVYLSLHGDLVLHENEFVPSTEPCVMEKGKKKDQKKDKKVEKEKGKSGTFLNDKGQAVSAAPPAALLCPLTPLSLLCPLGKQLNVPSTTSITGQQHSGYMVSP